MSRNIKKNYRVNLRRNISVAIILIILVIIALTTILPMLVTINASFKTRAEWAVDKISLVKHLYLGNYIEVFKQVNITRGFINSIIITVGGIIGVLIVGIMAAYAATKIRFWGRNFLFLFIIASMMIPIQTILFPFFKVVNDLNLANRYIGLILVHITFALPVTVFQLSSYFKRIPKELIESAKIDGASTFQIIFFIMCPVSIPAIATISLLEFFWIWNDLLITTLVMGDTNMKTLVTAVSAIGGQYADSANVTLMLPGVIISLIPVALIYFIAQRYLIKGMTLGAVKE